MNKLEGEKLKNTLLKLRINQKKIKNTKEYYDEEEDLRIIKEYYRYINFDDADPTNLYEQLNRLTTSTHENQLPYNSETRDYLYSTIDLHMDGNLKSIYSGSHKDPEQTIKEDHETVQLRQQEYEKLSSYKSEEDDLWIKSLAKIERDNMFNCEHVVPQSWFDEDNPMRGDLHHLFTCDKKCNSTRSNYPYVDFKDYTPDMDIETIKTQCGKYEKEKFEPESGKGEVARATLYFLIRYPGIINQYNDLDIETLLNWHQKFEVSKHEKHRNKEIFHIQKNRNPLIDFPEYADRINFKLSKDSN
ncbi:endonuclease [Gracilibacillus caseinilyticus]|uniref:Endonuclease n=1 Tax=Gracilibacillus caseinilyticus TaxID=2932256 RepID=A0ABY4EV88_9BACI|nr:endonuclease [Gracilibacillus caseinilyticus]UOQ47793.1 endonuclease [Gracilibacillus caseinilyticus]